MNPRLDRYLIRLDSLLRRHWLIDDYKVDFNRVGENEVRVKGRVEIYGGSILYVTEDVTIKDNQLTKINYRYQFRNEDEPGFFRYDCASHGRPEPYHHKHTYNQLSHPVEKAPELRDILNEIESILFPE